MVAISAARSPRFSSATATDPSASGLVHVSVVPAGPTRVPWTPSRSWSIASTSSSSRMSIDSWLRVRGSLEMTSGAAATVHSDICVRNSSVVMPSSGPR